MADKKISALTAATTPLDGTEVLPIVQSGSTVKVANNDLRPKQVQSNATSGVLQIAGPAASATRVMTVPDANFTAARTDAANSFTGDQTLSTGNLVQGTAAKGFDFSANSTAAGKTSTLLNWYEEGTWTPTVTSAAGSITSYTATGLYTRIGRIVNASLRIQITNAGTATGAAIATLPYNGKTGWQQDAAGRDDNSGNMLQGRIPSGLESKVYILFYNNSGPIATNADLMMTITYAV